MTEAADELEAIRQVEATATGIWATDDLLIFGDGRELDGTGHYHETYEKRVGSWRIKPLRLTRTILKMSGGDGGR